MKRLALAVLLSSLSCTSFALAQDQKPRDPAKPVKVDAKPAKVDAKPAQPADDKTKEMDAWMKAAEPGPQHKQLAQFEGEWTTEMKELGTDGSAASTNKGTTVEKMVMGGRFLQIEHDGRYQGKFFKGAGLIGYNNLDKRFESTWADSMGTGIMFMTGDFDAAGKVLTLTGECMMPDGTKGTMKEVTTWISKDSHKSEFFDGKGTKMMEITYTKGDKAEVKKEMKEEKKEEKKAEKAADKPKK